MPAVAAGFRGPRPPVVPGQSTASRGASGARPALGVTASPAHRDRLLSHGTALADVSRARDIDLVAGAICQAGIFSEGICVVSKMACPGSDSGGLGFCRYHGIADPAQAAWLGSAPEPHPNPPAVRRWIDGFRGRAGRDISVRL